VIGYVRGFAARMGKSKCHTNFHSWHWPLLR
jgi:hypothetical protein